MKEEEYRKNTKKWLFWTNLRFKSGLVYWGYELVLLLRRVRGILRSVKTYWRYDRHFSKLGYPNTLWDALKSGVSHSIGVSEYYEFKLYSKDKNTRSTYLGEFLRCDIEWALWMNTHMEYHFIQRDKYAAFCLLNDYYKRTVMLFNEQSELGAIINCVKNGGGGMLKPRYGLQGIGQHYFSGEEDEQDIRKRLISISESKEEYVFEELIEQHHALNELYPKSVNTIRAHTIYDEGVVHFLGAALRIGNGGKVDNLGAGGLAAPIDDDSGIITGPAISKAIILEDKKFYKHPITDVNIIGFQIPFWGKLRIMLEEMAQKINKMRCPAWDIAITEDGPVLVEINDNWDTVLFQKPFQEGRLYKLLPFIDKKILKPAHRKYYQL